LLNIQGNQPLRELPESYLKITFELPIRYLKVTFIL